MVDSSLETHTDVGKGLAVEKHHLCRAGETLEMIRNNWVEFQESEFPHFTETVIHTLLNDLNSFGLYENCLKDDFHQVEL